MIIFEWRINQKWKIYKKNVENTECRIDINSKNRRRRKKTNEICCFIDRKSIPNKMTNWNACYFITATRVNGRIFCHFVSCVHGTNVQYVLQRRCPLIRNTNALDIRPRDVHSGFIFTFYSRDKYENLFMKITEIRRSRVALYAKRHVCRCKHWAHQFDCTTIQHENGTVMYLNTYN